jgi:hypothetical protein
MRPTWSYLSATITNVLPSGRVGVFGNTVQCSTAAFASMIMSLPTMSMKSFVVPEKNIGALNAAMQFVEVTATRLRPVLVEASVQTDFGHA